MQCQSQPPRLPLQLLVVLLSVAVRNVGGIQLPRPRLPWQPWYHREGVAFDCTGCGRCCQMDGDVWLAPEEESAIRSHLGMADDAEVFNDLFIRQAVGPPEDRWVALKHRNSSAPSHFSDAAASSPPPLDDLADANSAGGCVFLDAFGKCSIYEVRPVQCSTYPFWPSLVDRREDWEDEAVLPDDEPLPAGGGLKHWSLADGGCEGIRLGERAQQEGGAMAGGGALGRYVNREEIAEKRELALRHWERFPDEDIKETTWYL